MAIKISKGIVSKLPEGEQENIEQVLWDKSAGHCFLCEEKMNRASDNIEADHDVPESEGGPTSIKNLNLAHVSCNRAKRNAKTIPIRPYLKLAAFIRRHGGRLRYDGITELFEIQPANSVVELAGDKATFEFPDGSTAVAQVFTESNGTGEFHYVFVEAPRNAIFNDTVCQPRVVKPDHVWQIFSDIQQNPLHEPPSCRVEHANWGSPVRLLMFDGQHKTVANWMMGRKSVVLKVYLDLNDTDANRLVNSIQSKIKKLPLSPFELAGHMSDEFDNKFQEYEEEVGTSQASEAGFIKWLPAVQRARAKQAFHSALLQGLLTNNDLRLSNYIKQQGKVIGPVWMTEQTAKAKVLERLTVMEPQALLGEEEATFRDQEAANIIMCLNAFTDLAFEPQEEAKELTDVERERARRMTYQSSLAYISTLIRVLWSHIQMQGAGKTSMAGASSPELWEKINDGIRALVDHPAWTAEFTRDDQMQRLKVALEKNQEVAQAFEGLGLDLAYLIVGKDSGAYKKAWG